MSLENGLVTIVASVAYVIAEEENQWKRRRLQRRWMMSLFKSIAEP